MNLQQRSERSHASGRRDVGGRLTAIARQLLVREVRNGNFDQMTGIRRQVSSSFGTNLARCRNSIRREGAHRVA